jgi:hypothetical protein
VDLTGKLPEAGTTEFPEGNGSFWEWNCIGRFMFGFKQAVAYSATKAAMLRGSADSRSKLISRIYLANFFGLAETVGLPVFKHSRLEIGRPKVFETGLNGYAFLRPIFWPCTVENYSSGISDEAFFWW